MYPRISSALRGPGWTSQSMMPGRNGVEFMLSSSQRVPFDACSRAPPQEGWGVAAANRAGEDAMITEEQLDQFVRDGAVTIDTPLTGEQIAAAVAVLDRLLPFRPAEEGRPARYRASLT